MGSQVALIYTLKFNLALLTYLINFEVFLHSLNGESGRALHLVYKFDKQISSVTILR